MGINRKAFLWVLCLIIIPHHLFAKGEEIVLLNLSGNWKFSIGDNIDWAQPDFNDTSWETIKVPSAWEDQGFYGYDGYGWYRTSFMVTREMKSKEIYLTFGYISDVDQVFINGNLIGFSGSFPPYFSSAQEAKRRYPIPEEFLNIKDKNIISVRVYNHQMEGGIISGEVGIVTYSNNKTDIPLAGMWFFKTGDNPAWKDSGYQDKRWNKIMVPGNWENQGFKNYSGIAWYRKHIKIPKEFENQKLVLILGKIKDPDEVYINNALVDLNGDFQHSGNKDKNKKEEDLEHKKPKYYVIPKNLLKCNQLNLISVKVLSNKDKGGLVEGPIGFIKSTNFVKYQKELIFTETDE